MRRYRERPCFKLSIFYILLLGVFCYLAYKAYQVNYNPEIIKQRDIKNNIIKECDLVGRRIKATCLSQPMAQFDACNNLGWIKEEDCRIDKGFTQ